MSIIDFRVRPPLAGFLDMVMYTMEARRDRFTRQLGLEPAPSATAKSVDMLLAEMDAAGVTKGVVVGRLSGFFGSVSNQDVAAIIARYPDHFVAIASIDPTDRRKAIAEIDTCMARGFRGVNVEPGSYPVPILADDPSLYAVYAHCEARDIPVILMTGGNAGPDIQYSFPAALDRILADFTALRVVVSHGNWPWVHQILHIAFRRPNLYVSPDMYLANMPGMDDYLKAADSWLADRFVYASCYPLAPLEAYADWFRRLPIRPDNMARILHGNAAQLLGLDA